tara:strand:- start:369 stop:533 length:165 start_codon:yes stop_codon:yes gene_type:complete
MTPRDKLRQALLEIGNVELPKTDPDGFTLREMEFWQVLEEIRDIVKAALEEDDK